MIQYGHEKYDETDPHCLAKFSLAYDGDVSVVLFYVMVSGLPLGRRDGVHLDVFHLSLLYRMRTLDQSAFGLLSGVLAWVFPPTDDLSSSHLACAHMRRRMVGPSVLLRTRNKIPRR